MNWQGKNVLVTGAGGFIGSHLVERLVREGARVRAFVKYNSRNDKGLLGKLSAEIENEVEVFFGDIRDADAVNKSLDDIDIVLHLAALISIPYSYVNPIDYGQTNVIGTMNVLNAGRRHDIERIVHTSTSEVYGTAIYVPIDEKHPLQPQSPYSASKIGADSIATSYFLSFDTPVTIIRPFNTYGPRQSLRAVIPTIISQAIQGNQIKLGCLDSTRDFNYVEDTVDGFMKMAECEDAIGKTINIGTGSEISIGKLVETIGALLGIEIEIQQEDARLRPQASEVFRLCAANDLATEVIGWQHRVSLEEGLGRTIEWMKESGVSKDVGKYVV